MNQRKYKYNPLYKNILSLRVNPLNNNKFLKLVYKVVKYKTIKCPSTKQSKKIPVWRWVFIKNTKKEKWQEFLDTQIQSKNFFNRFKPYTSYAYKSSKFASQGNSFSKKFKNNLLAKIIFNYLYGGLSRKYLKDKMTKIYTSKKIKSSISICTEFFESRLDSVLYKAKFCKSVKSAQQLITHKHVKVNNIIEKNKAYILKKGDLITFNSRSLKLVEKNLKEKIQSCPDFVIWPFPSSYLNINYKTLEIIMGDINAFNFSNSFNLKPNTHSVITTSYRN